MCHKICHFIWGIKWYHRWKDFEANKVGKLAIRPKSSPNLNFCSIKSPIAGHLYNDFVWHLAIWQYSNLVILSNNSIILTIDVILSASFEGLNFFLFFCFLHFLWGLVGSTMLGRQNYFEILKESKIHNGNLCHNFLII